MSRGRPRGMVEFTPDDEQCDDIARRLVEGSPDAFKQQLQKDGVNLFAAVCKPPKTKMATRAQLEDWPCMIAGTPSALHHTRRVHANAIEAVHAGALVVVEAAGGCQPAAAIQQ